VKELHEVLFAPELVIDPKGPEDSGQQDLLVVCGVVQSTLPTPRNTGVGGKGSPLSTHCPASEESLMKP
jgi:hypothetical protein